MLRHIAAVAGLLLLGCDSGASRNNLASCTEDLETATGNAEQATAIAKQAIDLAKTFDTQLDYVAKKYHFDRKDLP